MKRIKLIVPLVCLLVGCASIQRSPEETTDEFDTVGYDPPDTLHFELSEGNNIVFEAILNATDTLNLFWDTGATDLILKHSSVQNKTTLLKGKNENYSGENFDRLDELNSLSLGSMSWDSLIVYATSTQPEEVDGHFGWDLFEGKIVELDYDKSVLIVHNSSPGGLDTYSKMEIEYINTLFCIRGNLFVGDQQFPNRYLFDSGFQRAIVLDKDLRKAEFFPDSLPVLKETKLRNSEGTEFVNRVVLVDQICFGDVCANQIPVQLFATPNPARFETHILGNELLKRFNTVFDFKDGFIYLKPNSLMGLPYRDAL